MEFLVKKSKENPSGVLTTKELKILLKKANIIDKNEILDLITEAVKVIVDLEDKLKESEEKYIKNIKEVISNTSFNLAQPISINSHPSIEKDTSIALGTIYRDAVNDRLRIKMSIGWKTIKLD